MAPLTGALTFSTIVGLLSNFKSERSGRDMDQFIKWLKEKQLNDVAGQIESNQSLLGEISKLLSINHDELVEKLNALDRIMSSVVAHVAGFSGVAKCYTPW